MIMKALLTAYKSSGNLFSKRKYNSWVIPLIIFSWISPLHMVFAFQKEKPLFEALSPKKTGVNFKNQLKEDAKNNILTYEYFYNGGGVAVADFNNDGLEDLFFTGNMSPNKLYQNLGDFKFKDISKAAGIEGKNAWTTGVTVVDLNGDGFLDIYVCYSGNGDQASKRNQLFINQGDMTFREEANKFGLDDPSNSTQAVFFDFDGDGDLDMFLLNHNITVINEIEFDEARKQRHPTAGDKLFRNDNGKFVDVSEEAGILGNAMGFGLAVIVSDLNQDGFPDLLVTNDYIEPDYLYINNGDGTFTDKMTEHFQHISHFSMGADIGDINNDGLMDIFTLDMLPEDNRRQKLLYGPENYEQYALMVMKGFYHQNMRNMLHLNHGNGDFSEIGQLAGISNTDWSWSALFFDANNNGWKDLLVTNGYYRDYTNRDFLKYKGDYFFKKAVAGERADTLHLVTTMTSTPVSNYIFENNQDLTFTDQSKNWGISKPNFSSGAVYADLDNDGFLDLVISNLNETAGIYRNTGANKKAQDSKFLKVNLKGKPSNTFGIGSKITLYAGQSIQIREQYPVRGFQSTLSHTLHFGLGDIDYIDSLIVIWPNGSKSTLKDQGSNQMVTINQEEAVDPNTIPVSIQPRFSAQGKLLPHTPQEDGFNDFKRQPLLINMPSYVGPVMASADINGDGLTEIFVGGTKNSPGALYHWNKEEWKKLNSFYSSDEFTDAAALFFDANGNGYQDLYLASGGYHDYLSTDDALQDRLYLNDGKGNLKLSKDALPKMLTSSSTVVSADINGDGFPDLFVGSRIVPGRYPLIPSSHILINQGDGTFREETNAYLPDGGKLGMVTAAAWTDLNQDGKMDLIVVGEFMPIRVLINENGVKLVDKSEQWLGKNLTGWWSSLAIADFDGDGRPDIVVGNYGLNSQLGASVEEPLTLYAADFDENGSIDPILVHYIQGKPYPFASRDELLDQMYGMRSKFTDYGSYSNAVLEDIFSAEQLKNAIKLEAEELRSVWLHHQGDRFEVKPLPNEAQFAPVTAIHPFDHNGDGHYDVLLAGNQTYIRIRMGVIDANFGVLFEGDGNGNFTYIPQRKSGFRIKGDVKSILEIDHLGENLLLFGINNFGVESYVNNRKERDQSHANR
ncbi:VCBS repeat-containing protein [Pararhodonellum marinum]|uniref:VCBS repeat-containing protein n=1 Tax=Pararhodonellum marinum TaxID=2755358 RepID=UPI001E537EC7|nr:VCBS repeat-containing protein [Pararhodonellum marinum]